MIKQTDTPQPRPVRLADRGAPLPAYASYGRALLGAAVMALALGTAGALGELAHLRLGLDGTARQALTAVLCGGIAVPLVLWLRRRVDRRPVAGLGLAARGAARSFGLGVLVTGGAAAATFALGTALGMLRWGAVDGPVLARYLLVNALVALALEAVPEELTLRGYAYRNLSARLRRWTAALCTVLLFLAVPAGSTVVQWALAGLLGGPVTAPSFAPAGQDPVSYAVLLVVFGCALLVARITTGSLWTGIALHLTFLTVNRITLDGAARGAGWSAEPLTPDALLLVPGYLLLTAVAFLVLARLRGRRTGWRERDPYGAEADAAG
ncbi:CPBP family intramembrane glutamic endopeptidase [Streptomyces sp. NPDC003077]|uniref:CPBP family intramembrane glutamic endopeptidase n=1 Tax=Streptomyces sp. NPDC003077 TaxID=3154443 RepID=UPI0033BBCF91